MVNRVLNAMPAYEQKSFITSTIRLLNKGHLLAHENTTGSEWWKSNSNSVAAVAGYLQSMIQGNASRVDMLVSWLTSLNGSGVGESVAIRRSVVAVVAKDRHRIEQVLEKIMHQFGDHLYIKHTPSLQQEGKIWTPQCRSYTNVPSSSHSNPASGSRQSSEIKSFEAKNAHKIQLISERSLEPPGVIFR